MTHFIPIYQNYNKCDKEPLLFTRVWHNFLNDLGETFLTGWNEPSQKRLEQYNGTLINDVVVFKSEQDKIWFILRWS